MRDLTKEIIKASKLIKEYNNDILLNLLKEWKINDKSVKIDWDYDAGENWATFLVKNNMVAIVGFNFPIIFVEKSYHGVIFQLEVFANYRIVVVDDFDSKCWDIDLDILSNEVPNFLWYASAESVNVKAMSINDLWYATI